MIRHAEDKDIERIKLLLEQVHRVHAEGRPDLFKLGGIKYTDIEVKEIIRNEKTPVFVYTNEQDVLLGYLFGVYSEVEGNDTCRVANKTFYIDDLCVEQSQRGNHIGEKLYRFALEEAKKNGCYNVTLHVWDCNPSAMRFYEKMGLATMNRTLEQIL